MTVALNTRPFVWLQVIEELDRHAPALRTELVYAGNAGIVDRDATPMLWAAADAWRRAPYFVKATLGAMVRSEKPAAAAVAQDSPAALLLVRLVLVLEELDRLAALM